MKLTEARILYLARESLERMRSEGLIEARNFAMALRHARELIAEFIASGDQVDIAVRRKNSERKVLRPQNPAGDKRFRNALRRQTVTPVDFPSVIPRACDFSMLL
jgi:hypothetical protein